MFDYNDPIIHRKRTGNTPEDPFVDMNETLTVNSDGKVDLTELPDSFSRVKVTSDTNVQLFEIQNGLPNENQFKVNYTNKIVTLHVSHAGKQFNFQYKGRGLTYIPDSMIYTEKGANGVKETLKQLTNETKLARDTANQTNETVTLNENTRVQNENQRITDETTRLNNESTRQTKETERQNAESTRISDENTRKSNETTRISAEDTRISNEETRKTSESSRQSEELTRKSNETNRVQQETFRSNAEEARVTAEEIREQQEDDRQTNTNAAIGRVDSVVAETRYKNVYSPTTTYKKNNVVYNNGSAYMAKQDTTGNTPTDDPANAYWALISRKGADGNGTIHVYKDTFVATEGQTIFTLKNTYDQFSNRTNVTVGGVPQRTPENYEEASSNTIVLNDPVPAGTIVEVKYYSEALPLQTDLQTTVDNHTVEINKFNDQSIHTEKFIATEGQSIFTLQSSYDQLQDKIEVVVDGVPQDSGENFTESANNQITLSEGVPAGTEVKVKYFGRRLPIVTDVEATLNTHSSEIANHTTELNNHSSELSNVNAQLAETGTNRVYVESFKFLLGDTSDSQRIQRAVDAAKNKRVSRPSSGNTYIASQPEVVFEQGKEYVLDTKVNISEYTNIDGNDAIFKTAVNFPSTDFCFNGNTGAWMSKIKKMQFDGVKNAIYLNNNNLDQGIVTIDQCKFYGVEEAIKVECQSTVVSISNCKFDRCKHVLDIVKGDMVILQGGWIKQGNLTINKDATILNRGLLHIRDVVLVPATATGTETAWINNLPSIATGGVSPFVNITEVRFGGETGSKTVINNFVVADSTYPKNPNGFLIQNSQCYQIDGEAVRLFEIPNVITIENNRGFVDSVTMEWGIGVTPTTLLANAGGIANIKVSVRGNSGSNYILPEILAAMTEKEVFNSRPPSLLPLKSDGYDITDIGGGFGRFNFDIGLTETDAQYTRRVYMVEFTTNTSSGSSRYRGHFVGILTVTGRYNGSVVVSKVNLTPLVNITDGLSAGSYVVEAFFGNANTGSNEVAVSGTADRTISVKMDRFVAGTNKFRVYQTTDGTFVI